MSDSVIMFDIDGTLVDSTYHHALAWQRAFAGRDLTVPMHRVHRAIGMGGDRLVAHVTDVQVEERHGDALREAWQEEYAALLDEVEPLPGAAALVRETHGAGHVVALASSGEKRFSEAAVDLLGIADHVDVLTCSADADASKPDPDILGVTLDRASAERAVLVGDTPYDVEAAGRIGLACVAVLTGGFSRAELEAAGAERVVEDLTELAGLDWTPLLRPATT